MHKRSMRNLIRFYITNLVVLGVIGIILTIFFMIASFFNMFESFVPLLYVAFFPVTLLSLGISFYVTYKNRHKELKFELNYKVAIIIIVIIVMMILFNFLEKF